MPINADLVDRAKKLKRPALDELLAAMYPAVHRIAYALAGREDVAGGVIDFVCRRAVYHAPRWRDEADVERWFLHHTVLTTRRAAQHQPEPAADLLSAGEPGYAAFIRALRQLPQQQREAVILNLGEHLNERYLAVAMDCSTTAAQTHLAAGLKDLAAIAGDRFGSMCQMLAGTYAKLAPGADSVLPGVRTIVSRGLRPRKLRIALAIGLVAASVVLAVWIAWRFR